MSLCPEDAAGEDEHSGSDLAMRRPMLDCWDPASWPVIGRERLALTNKLFAIRRENPVFANLGSQARPSEFQSFPFQLWSSTFVRPIEVSVGFGIES